MEREASYPSLPGSVQRLVQQPVGVRVVARAHVVGLVVEDRIDVLCLHELLDMHDLAALAGGCLHLLVLEHDVPAGGDLVALDDLVVVHLLPLLRADATMLDLGSVLRMHLAEVDGLRLDGGEELDRYVYEAEGDRPVPDRAWRHDHALPGVEPSHAAVAARVREKTRPVRHPGTLREGRRSHRRTA